MARAASASERDEDGQPMWSRLVAAVPATPVLLLGGSLSGALGMAPAIAQELAPQPPPPPQVESPGPPLGPDAVWIAGHWLWRNGRYEWMPGRGGQRPRPERCGQGRGDQMPAAARAPPGRGLRTGGPPPGGRSRRAAAGRGRAARPPGR